MRKNRFKILLFISSFLMLSATINLQAQNTVSGTVTDAKTGEPLVGANIIMPNITPGMYRNNYKLYNNKPCVDEQPEDCIQCLDVRIQLADAKIGYGEWGDSKHFARRKACEV